MRKPLNLSRVTGSAAIGRRGGRKNKRQQQKQAGQETSSSHKTSHRSYPIMYCGHPDAANVGMIVVQFVARKNRALGCSAQKWTMIRQAYCRESGCKRFSAFWLSASFGCQAR